MDADLPPRLVTCFPYSDGNQGWKLVLNNSTLQIMITAACLPSRQNVYDAFPRLARDADIDEIGAAWEPVLNQMLPPPDEDDFWDQHPAGHMGQPTPGPSLFRLMFSNPQAKDDPAAYMQALFDMVHFLERDLGLLLTPTWLEIALDTGDRIAGEKLRERVALRNANSRLEIFYSLRKGHKAPGGNPNDPGLGECHGGGHQARQLCSYVRTPKRQDLTLTFNTIYRTELRLKRPWIGRFMRDQGFNRLAPRQTIELLRRTPKVLKRNLSLTELDFGKLYQHFPDARNWQLEQLSTRGQIHMLRQHPELNGHVSKFFATGEFPDFVLPRFRLTDSRMVIVNDDEYRLRMTHGRPRTGARPLTSGRQIQKMEHSNTALLPRTFNAERIDKSQGKGRRKGRKKTVWKPSKKKQ